MDDVLLSPEEIEKRKELFEYEMTQVILALRDKYANPEQARSIAKEFGLTEKEFENRLEFVPFLNNEIELASHDIPAIRISTEYNPLSDVRPAFEYDDNIRELINLDSSAKFTPLTDIKADTISQSIPNAKIALEYKSIQASTDNVTEIEVPSIASVSQYKTYAPTEATKTFKQDIPSTQINVEYKASKIVDIKTEISDIPKVVGINQYAPYAASEDINSLGDLMPSIGKIQDFSPLVLQEDAVHSIDVPKVDYSLDYMRFEAQTDLRKIECPVVGNISSFSPIDAPVVDSLNMEIPKISNILNYSASKISLEKIPQTTVSPIEKILTYKPVKVADFKRAENSIPNHKIEIEYSKKVDVELSNLNSEASVLAQDIISKDFYSMWMDM